MNAIALKIPRLTLAEFVELCQVNQNLRLEMTATGEVIIMPQLILGRGSKTLV
ncbi:hypothetical protein [Phormidesmis priestleyi]|uniref:hypothetical protein n=1 Tax=Phormidesmis priestleyi TaxID=268141 RepID=UPI000A7430DC|nr:hypothetical protein [Phormidesmis priestleyi]